MNKLPLWVLNNKYPSIFDSESKTALEQTARVYGAMQDLIEDYNKFVTNINNHIEQYEDDTNENIDLFAKDIRQEFQDFIDVINLKVKASDNLLNDINTYVRNNLKIHLLTEMEKLLESEDFNESVASVLSNEIENATKEISATQVQLTPLFANSLDDLKENGDTSKVYVLPDGYIYAYSQYIISGTTSPNFTNLMTNPNSYIKNGYRYSQSSGIFKECETDCAIVIPIPSTSGAFTVRIRGASLTGSNYFTSAYFGTDNQSFSGVNDVTKFTFTTESNGDLKAVQSSYDGGYNYFVLHVANGVSLNNLIVTLNEEITYSTTSGSTNHEWTNTGHAFVPQNYEERIIETEQTLEEHETRIDDLENNNNSTGLSLEHNSCSIFRKVVCCGDSFTCGYIGIANDNIVQTNYDYSWVSFMARLTGNEYVNCGHSGKDVLTWQTSQKGLLKAQAVGKAQAYLIGLGLNDSSLVTLGSATDIGTENQTYYGGLSKIIRELNAISPTAKIFVQTIPSDYVVYKNYSQAMRDVVNAYKDTYPVHLLDLYNYKDMYKTVKIQGDASLGHYTAIGYQQFAENLRYIWSEYINNNISMFQDVHLIPFDETPIEN